MSSLCSDAQIDFAVGDTLRRLSRDREHLKVTASGIARMIHAPNVEMVQNALVDAATKKLLKPALRYRCTECGSLNAHVGPRKPHLECLEHGDIDHEAVAIYEFTALLHEIASKENVSPKKASRRRAPLLSRIAQTLREWVRSVVRTR